MPNRKTIIAPLDNFNMAEAERMASAGALPVEGVGESARAPH